MFEAGAAQAVGGAPVIPLGEFPVDEQAGIEACAGTVGDSYDNALAETIIGLYKTEVIRTRGPWKTLDDVEYATLEWGQTGSILVVCWRPSAMCRRLSMNRCTMMM